MIKLSLVGISIMIIGTILVGISIAQWFFRFPDPSQLLLGVGIGVCFILFGYLHSWMRSKDKDDEETNKAIDAVRIWQVDETEKINKRIDNLQ